MARKLGIGCLGFVVLMVIIGVFAGGGGKGGQPSTSTPAAGATSTPESKLTAAVRSAHLLGKIDMLSVSPSAGEAGKWIVDAHLQLEDVSDVGPAALMDFLAIDRAAYTTGVPLQWVALTGAYPMRDSYGNTKFEDIVVVKLPEVTAAKVNWAGITYQDLWKISDKIMVYPAFARAVSGG